MFRIPDDAVPDCRAPFMQYLFVAVLVGLIPAFIASSKGRSFLLWWIYGALLLIVALPHALLMSADPNAGRDLYGPRKAPPREVPPGH